MKPSDIVAFIKEKPTSDGVALLLELFGDQFTITNSAIDPTPVPKETWPFPPKPYDPDDNPHPLDKPAPGSPDARAKVVDISSEEDPLGRSYFVHKEFPFADRRPGKLHINGKEASQDEIDAVRNQLNRDAAEQLKQMREGTYKWLDRNVAPDKTHGKFPDKG